MSKNYYAFFVQKDQDKIQCINEGYFLLQMKTIKLKLNDLIRFSQILVIYKANLLYKFLEKIIQIGYCGLLLAHFLHTSILTSDGGTLGTIHVLRQQCTGWVGLENGQFC